MTLRAAVWAVVLTAVAGCGLEGAPEDVAADGELHGAQLKQAIDGAPAAKSLAISWQGQQTGYWCGPGSTRIALTAKMASPPSQTTLANYMGTTTNGTDHIGLPKNALNKYLNTTAYQTRTISDPPTAAQREALKQSLVASVTNGYALVANVVSGWRPPGYPGGTIYHYVAVVGYDQGGERALIADPAGKCAAGSRWCNVPSTYWVSLSNLATWIGGKGFAGTFLPVVTTPTASTGTLIGTIYEKGNTANRVAGAVVTASGKSVTTGADGIYRLELPAGSHTATVTKAGYATASVTRTVTVGAQVWGSMEINASAATGVLNGKVYAYVAAMPGNTDQAIAGATVSVAGQTKSTAADGAFSFTLPPGTHTVTASKAGFANATVTRTVTAGGTVQAPIGLGSATGPDLQPPQVAIAFPANGAQLDLAVLNLEGTASDDQGAVNEVSLAIGTGASTSVPVTGGKFSIEVKLAPGLNTITVTAKDAAGNPAKAVSTATFNAGVFGTVHLEGDESALVTQATVELVAKDGESSLGTATVDAKGGYAIAVSQVPVEAIVVVKAPGFRTARESVEVPDDRRLQVNVGLLTGTDELGTQAALRFTSPSEGDVIATERVVVKGSVVGFEVESVSINGARGSVTAEGLFEVEVPLTEGANRLEAIASGTGGERITKVLNVTRKLDGSVPPGTTKAGCASVGLVGAELAALLLAVPALVRRRRAARH